MECDQFSDVKTVISEPLKFKSKLAIGEDAYASVRLMKIFTEYRGAYGWASTGAAAAQSAAVASTFFPTAGFLGALGIGTAATPVGWVIAAAIFSGGAAIGVSRFLKESSEKRVTVIPKFINTPIDFLAVSLFDLMAPLALKVAAIDGEVTEDERKWIKGYFVNEWGYDGLFLVAGFQLIEEKLEEFTIKEIADSLAEFSKANPDCNYPAISRDLVGFLRGVMEADGKIDEREELAIERIEVIFRDAGRTFSHANLSRVGSTVVGSIKSGAESIGTGVGALGQSAKKNSEAFVNSETYSRAAETVGSAKASALKGAGVTLNAGKNLVGKFFKK